MNFKTAGTLGSVSMNMCTLLFGWILDKWGTFASRALGALTVTIGLVLLLFTPQVHWFLYPGIIFYAAPSFSFLVTNQFGIEKLSKYSNKKDKFNQFRH